MEDAMSRNKTFAAAAIVIGLVLVIFFVFTDYPPSDENVAGTMAQSDTTMSGIQPASRYRSSQISDEDVTLEDATFQDA